MVRRKISDWLDKLSQAGWRLVRNVDEKAHGWPGVLGRATKNVLKPYSVISAAAISYFTLFSIFPIILLSVTLASFNINPLMDWHYIIQVFEFIAPALDQLLGQNIAAIVQMRGPITGVALISLIWSGSTVFYTLTQTLNEIWGYRRLSSVWKRRALAILFVLAIIGPLLFLASFTGSIMDNVRTWLPGNLVIFGKGISFLVAFLLDVILLALIYLLLPHGRASWREILPGAVAAGFLWELAKKGFLLFVSSYVDATNLVYGSLAAIIAFLTWAYLSGLIFLFGAYFNLAYFQLKHPKLEAEGS